MGIEVYILFLRRCEIVESFWKWDDLNECRLMIRSLCDNIRYFVKKRVVD